MYAEVGIASGGEEPVVTVSDSAVIDTGTRQVVILDRGEGGFEPREVPIGRRGQGVVEIRAGVNEGDRVVVSAHFLIDAESNPTAALSTMAAPEKARRSEEHTSALQSLLPNSSAVFCLQNKHRESTK